MQLDILHRGSEEGDGKNQLCASAPDEMPFHSFKSMRFLFRRLRSSLEIDSNFPIS